jgi:hypothetical protein
MVENEAVPAPSLPAWPPSALGGQHAFGMPAPADDPILTAPPTTPAPPPPPFNTPISPPVVSMTSAPPASEPAYTVPASPGRASGGTVYPSGGGAAVYSGAQGGAPQASAQQAYTAPKPAAEKYGEWARSQRPQGTVYGGSAGAGSLPAPMENSGSLTGHILSQGTADLPPPKSRTAKVLLIILGILVVLVGGGLAVAYYFQDFITGLFNDFTNAK